MQQQERQLSSEELSQIITETLQYRLAVEQLAKYSGHKKASASELADSVSRKVIRGWNAGFTLGLGKHEENINAVNKVLDSHDPEGDRSCRLCEEADINALPVTRRNVVRLLSDVGDALIAEKKKVNSNGTCAGILLGVQKMANVSVVNFDAINAGATGTNPSLWDKCKADASGAAQSLTSRLPSVPINPAFLNYLGRGKAAAVSAPVADDVPAIPHPVKLQVSQSGHMMQMQRAQPGVVGAQVGHDGHFQVVAHVITDAQRQQVVNDILDCRKAIEMLSRYSGHCPASASVAITGLRQTFARSIRLNCNGHFTGLVNTVCAGFDPNGDLSLFAEKSTTPNDFVECKDQNVRGLLVALRDALLLEKTLINEKGDLATVVGMIQDRFNIVPAVIDVAQLNREMGPEAKKTSTLIDKATNDISGLWSFGKSLVGLGSKK
jgi:hypothetical protein